MILFEKKPSYQEWCEALGRDPEDDENYISYCEWKNGND
jgi:hypothetical protein